MNHVIFKVLKLVTNIETVVESLFFFKFSTEKKIRCKRNTNHFYLALKFYLFWVSLKVHQMQNLVEVCSQLKIKRKQRFKIQQKFQYLTPISTFEIWHDPYIRRSKEWKSKELVLISSKLWTPQPKWDSYLPDLIFTCSWKSNYILTC